jgi:hypothetical protein
MRSAVEPLDSVLSDVRAWLGFFGLWLNILEAKAKTLVAGLAWPGFGLSQGLGHFFQKASNGGTSLIDSHI